MRTLESTETDNTISNGLPEGWASAALGSLGEYVNGRAFKSSEWSDNGRLIIRIQDLTKSKENPNYYSGEIEPWHIVRRGDLLVSWSATLGAYIWDGPESVLNQHIFKVRSDIDTKFHFYLVQQFLADLRRQTHGSGLVHVTKSDFTDTLVSVPPLAEQFRIAAAIDLLASCVREARDHLSRIPAILKRFRQAVLAAACSGKLTEDWRESTDTAAFRFPVSVCDRLDESQLPELPDKWLWTTVGALAAHEKNAITDGPFGSNLKTEHYTQSGPRVIRLQNIAAYRFVDVQTHVSPEHFEKLTKHRISAGDAAIACLGDPVPRACVIPESVGPAIVKADCVRFRPNPEAANVNYVCYVLNDISTRARMSETVHGVGRARLNLQQIKSIPVPLPPLQEQFEVVRRVEAMLQVGEAIEHRVAKAAALIDKLTQSILAKAFRGELVLTEAELARREGRDYETASVLLDRIRAQKAGQAKTPSNPKRRLNLGMESSDYKV